MNNAVLVRFRQAVNELNHDVHGFFRKQRPAPDFLCQRQALVVGHDDERLAVGGLFQPVDYADIVVVEPGGSSRLLQEALFLFGGHVQLMGQELESDRAI